MNQEERTVELSSSAISPAFTLILRQLWSRVGLILSIVLAVEVVALFATLTTRPQYEGVARVLLEMVAPRVVDFDKSRADDETRFLFADDYLKSQVEVLRSETLARRVVTALNLKESPEFKQHSDGFWDWSEDGYGKLSQKVQGWLRDSLGLAAPSSLASPTAQSSPSSNSSRQSASDREDALTIQLLSRSRVASLRQTRVLEIGYRGFYPKEVASVANAIVDQYIEWDLERTAAHSRSASKWLRRHLDELKGSVERSERALQAYREKENLIGAEIIEEPQTVLTALDMLNREVVTARSERIRVEAAYREFKRLMEKNGADSRLENVVAGLLGEGKGTLISDLQRNLAEAEREYANLSRRYKEKHPVLVQLTSRIEFLKRRVRQEIGNAVRRLEADFSAARERERNLNEVLNKEKDRLLRLGNKTVELGILKREVESNRRLYEMFLKRMKEADLSTNLRMTNIQIVDRATVPKSPVVPKKRQNLLLGLFFGLLLGVGVALGIEYFDTSLKDPEEAEQVLGVQVLGVIDDLGRLGRSRGKSENRLVAPRGEVPEAVEFFNALRTNILYSIPGGGQHIFLVTSATPAEGKTFVASNLAAAFGTLKKGVVLVDGDLRKPSLHTLYGVSREPGLSDYLVGRSSLEDILRQVSEDPMFLIPAGHRSPSPVNLLSSDRMGELLQELQKRFGYIVVDSPPISSVTDALVLVPWMGTLLYVMWTGHTPGRYILQGVRKLKEVQSAHGKGLSLGLVMNRVSRRRGNRFYYAHQRYGYYYEESR